MGGTGVATIAYTCYHLLSFRLGSLTDLQDLPTEAQTAIEQVVGRGDDALEPEKLDIVLRGAPESEVRQLHLLQRSTQVLEFATMGALDANLDQAAVVNALRRKQQLQNRDDTEERRVAEQEDVRRRAAMALLVTQDEQSWSCTPTSKEHCPSSRYMGWEQLLKGMDRSCLEVSQPTGNSVPAPLLPAADEPQCHTGQAAPAAREPLPQEEPQCRAGQAAPESGEAAAGAQVHKAYDKLIHHSNFLDGSRLRSRPNADHNGEWLPHFASQGLGWVICVTNHGNGREVGDPTPLPTPS